MSRKLFQVFMAVSAVMLSLGLVAAPAHATPTVAQFVNPVIGSGNIGETLPFTWTPAPNAQMYYLGVGTSAGSGNVFSSFLPPTQTSLALPSLPAGTTLWAGIWTEVSGTPGFSPGTSVSFTVGIAHFLNPVVGLRNLGLTGLLQWTQAPAAAEYYLGIGTAPGSANAFSAFEPATLSILAIPPLPIGQTLWARVWTEMPGFGWYNSGDVSFTILR